MDSLKPSSIVGFLDVFVHEARDIQNICIYQKQDVYAKLRLTSDPPESAAVQSTRTINGGGRNPVFNQTLRLGVSGPVESTSVRCEVWMLSRVRNYLEDQLLGFALVPLSDVVAAAAGGGKLVEEEFSLSSTDLFHSPSGFIKLSIEYTGSSPDVLAVRPVVPSPPAKPSATVSREGDGTAPRGGLDNIEFPDPNMVSENRMMVSEYFGIPCNNNLDDDAQDPDSSICPNDDDECPNHEAGVRVVESFAAVICPDPPPVEVSENDKRSTAEEEEEEEEEASSSCTTENAFPPPVINIDVEPPQHSVVQQDIVDMYMKSMKQFTESLANMKLPMDIENLNGNSGNGNGNGKSNADGSSGSGSGSGCVDAANGDSGADQKLLASKKTNSRVFYGSRAFF